MDKYFSFCELVPQELKKRHDFVPPPWLSSPSLTKVILLLLISYLGKGAGGGGPVKYFYNNKDSMLKKS